MTEEEFEEIKAREAKATSGPWVRKNHEVYPAEKPAGERDLYRIAVCEHPYRKLDSRHGEPDADFIAHARTDIPKLFSLIEYLQKQLARCSDDNVELSRQRMELQGDKRELSDALAAMSCACPEGINGICSKCAYFVEKNGDDVG